MGGKGGRCIRLTTLPPYHLRVLIVMKSGSLNLLEPSGPVQRLLYYYHLSFMWLLHASALLSGHIQGADTKISLRSGTIITP
jgi:hypothetical protein